MYPTGHCANQKGYTGAYIKTQLREQGMWQSSLALCMCILHLPVVDKRQVTAAVACKEPQPSQGSLERRSGTEAEKVQDESIFCNRNTAHPGYHSLSAGLSW